MCTELVGLNFILFEAAGWHPSRWGLIFSVYIQNAKLTLQWWAFSQTNSCSIVGRATGHKRQHLLTSFDNFESQNRRACEADEFNGSPEQHYFGMEGFDCGYNFMPFAEGPAETAAISCVSTLSHFRARPKCGVFQSSYQSVSISLTFP